MWDSDIKTEKISFIASVSENEMSFGFQFDSLIPYKVNINNATRNIIMNLMKNFVNYIFTGRTAYWL